jgi:hypothetical protein
MLSPELEVIKPTLVISALWWIIVDRKRTVLGQIGKPMLKGGARVVPYLLSDWLNYICGNDVTGTGLIGII